MFHLASTCQRERSFCNRSSVLPIRPVSSWGLIECTSVLQVAAGPGVPPGAVGGFPHSLQRAAGQRIDVTGGQDRLGVWGVS